MEKLIKEIEQLIKFDSISLKAAYDDYYPYEKVIFVEDLEDLISKLEIVPDLDELIDKCKEALS